MARAEVASASIRSDSIKGLAQSIAKPAYRRLLTAEPALRRAVPALIIAFLLTICVGTVVQILDHRRQAIFDLTKQIEACADVLVERLDQNLTDDSRARIQGELEHAIPSWARVPGRRGSRSGQARRPLRTGSARRPRSRLRPGGRRLRP